ncbi:MAG: hypothetical protein ABGY42_02305 [bacterium]
MEKEHMPKTNLLSLIAAVAALFMMPIATQAAHHEEQSDPAVSESAPAEESIPAEEAAPAAEAAPAEEAAPTEEAEPTE